MAVLDLGGEGRSSCREEGRSSCRDLFSLQRALTRLLLRSSVVLVASKMTTCPSSEECANNSEGGVSRSQREARAQRWLWGGSRSEWEKASGP
jgi:hypothetical protein